MTATATDDNTRPIQRLRIPPSDEAGMTAAEMWWTVEWAWTADGAPDDAVARNEKQPKKGRCPTNNSSS